MVNSEKHRLMSADRVDHYLEFCIEQWADLPDLEAEIADWDYWSKANEIITWPVVEDRTGQLKRYAAAGLMAQEQAAKFGELESLVEKNHPIIEHLWKNYGM